MLCDYFKMDISDKNVWIKKLTMYQMNNCGMDEI